MDTILMDTICNRARLTCRAQGPARTLLLLAVLTLLLPAYFSRTLAHGAEAVVNHKLNSILANGEGDVGGASRLVDHLFHISPDGQRVVYLANQDSLDVFELYSVPIDGGPSTKLNRQLPAGGNVSGAAAEVDHPFRISPNSRYGVYLADQEVDDVFELYSVPIVGGDAVKLNAPLTKGGDVRGASATVAHTFRISPDSRYVIYLADQEADDVFELYSVPIAGGPPTKLNGGLAGGQGDVRGADEAMNAPFRISPDSQHVVYLADQDDDDVFELYSVAITGGAATKLNGAMTPGGDVRGATAELEHAFRISPDSRHVVYLADQDDDEVIELYSVPIEGGKSVKLNGALAGGEGDVRGAAARVGRPFRISGDSRRVVYLADQDLDETFELYSVAMGGGSQVKLNPTLADGRGDVRGAKIQVDNPFRISPNGRRVVYVANQESPAVFELYSVPIEGGEATKLNLPLADGRGDVRGADAAMANPFRISSDSKWVVYIADQDLRNVYELYSVPVAGGEVVKLNTPIERNGGAIRGSDNIVENPFRISRDAQQVIYMGDQDTVGVMELYSVSIRGGIVTKLNPTLANEQGTLRGDEYEMHNPFLLSADGRRAVYIADQEKDERFELFSAVLDGVNVQGAGQDVVDDDMAPRPGDDTDFGHVMVALGTVTKTFTIQNRSHHALSLGKDSISLAGEDRGDFEIVEQPAARVDGGKTTTFRVRFDPSGLGTRQATVDIANSEREPFYRFVIQGAGTMEP